MQSFFHTAAATALVLAMAAPDPALAQRRAEPQLQVSYPTDGQMSCEQLVAEIGRMEQIAGVSAQNAQSAQTQGALVDGAASVGLSAAIHSGAGRMVPGLGMFANAAGGAARRNAEARAAAEAERIRIADQRRSLLSGIYQGRQCGAPAAAPVAPPGAETGAAPSVAPPPAPDGAGSPLEPGVAPATEAAESPAQAASPDGGSAT